MYDIKMFFVHQHFGVCRYLKGGKLFESLYDGNTHIFNFNKDKSLVRPLTDKANLTAGANITAQASRGEYPSFGFRPEDRWRSWESIIKKNTFIGICQILGELMSLKILSEKDKVFKESLIVQIRMERELVEELQDVKT